MLQLSQRVAVESMETLLVGTVYFMWILKCYRVSILLFTFNLFHWLYPICIKIGILFAAKANSLPSKLSAGTLAVEGVDLLCL